LVKKTVQGPNFHDSYTITGRRCATYHPHMNSLFRSSKARDLLLLFGVCSLCFLWRLGSVDLFDFNEGFYAQVAREMALRGDYVTPRVNGIYFFDKPPLAIWLSAVAFKLFGTNEFAARLPVALAATALTLLTYAFGAKRFGRRAGLFAGMMVALNPMMIGTARQMTMDIHQSLWFAVALFCFFRGYTAETKRGKLWYYGFWAGCGLSFLAKSVPGLFPMLCAFVFLLVQERFQAREIARRVWEAKPIPGLLLLAAIIAPWHILAYQANGEIFYQEYWILHHVGLLHGTDFSHKQPFWYYLPALLAGLFPWALFLPWALRKPTAQEEQAVIARRFLLAWGWTVFIIFSLMKSKLISYLLPMYPAAAILVGACLDRTMGASAERAARPLKLGAILVAVIGVVGVVTAQIFAEKAKHSARLTKDISREFPPPVWDWVVHSLWLAVIGGLVAAALLFMKRREAGAWALIGTMAVFVGLAVTEGLNAIQATRMASLHGLARSAGALMEQGYPLAIQIARPRRPSIFFYLPDSAFLGKPLPGPGGEGLILERGELPPIQKFLDENPTAFVMTDTEGAEAIKLLKPAVTVHEQRGPWILLRSEEPPR
jgi:4-amino-4-deoxy-L-arabinose transferase-like glycosyltransferase